MAKRHIEPISGERHVYTVRQGGTMDGTNCRSPMGCGMNREGAIEQSWQSNRAVRMENVGQTDVVDPWLSDGRNNFRNIKEIVASVVTPGMSDGEKARALWYQQIRHRYHLAGGGTDLGDPGKGVQRLRPASVREGRQSDDVGRPVEAGADWKGAPVRLVGHAIAQVHYDGGFGTQDGWRLRQDLSKRARQRDAGERLVLACDYDLVRRTHTMGLLEGTRHRCARDEGTARCS